jgi:hypothetical protein
MKCAILLAVVFLTACGGPTAGGPTAPSGTASAAQTPAAPASGTASAAPTLTAQMTCLLPVVTWGTFDPRGVTASGAGGQGANVGFFQFPNGPALIDSGELIRFDPVRFRMLTLRQPVLEAGGQSSLGSWDAIKSRWVPVEAGLISPDGTAYAWTEQPSPEARRSRIHVTTVADGTDRVVLTSGAGGDPSVDFSVVRYDQDALLLTSLGASEGGWYNADRGLWRFDLNSDTLTPLIPQAVSWNLLSPHAAWSSDVDPNGGPPVAAPSPDVGPMPDRLVRFDLTTGNMTTWMTKPGTIVMVLGVDLLDRPLIRIQSSVSTELDFSIEPNRVTPVLRFSLPPVYGPSDAWNATGLGYRPSQVMSDAHGIWLTRFAGPQDKLSLFDPARGLVELTSLGQVDSVHPWHPAGPCLT